MSSSCSQIENCTLPPPSLTLALSISLSACLCLSLALYPPHSLPPSIPHPCPHSLTHSLAIPLSLSLTLSFSLASHLSKCSRPYSGGCGYWPRASLQGTLLVYLYHEAAPPADESRNPLQNRPSRVPSSYRDTSLIRNCPPPRTTVGP